MVITGSSRGIGEAIAAEFAKAGYNLVINSRDQEELSISKEEIIRAAGATTRVVTFPGDISHEEVCIEIINTAAQEFGTIDVLVNNAGINGPEKKSPEITTKEWDEVLDINLKGCFMCSREAIKKMLRQKEDRDGTEIILLLIFRQYTNPHQCHWLLPMLPLMEGWKCSQRH